MPQQDPMLRLRYYRETGQADEATKYERYLRETGQMREEQQAAAAPAHETGGQHALGATREAGQGLTFGLADEGTAAVRAVLPQALGGTEGFDYSGAVNNERSKLREYRGNHPWESKAVNAAGSLAPILLTGGGAAVARGAGLGAKMGSAALQGAKYGAAYGVGDAEGGLMDRMYGGAKGGAIGAVAGPLAVGVGRVASKAVGAPVAWAADAMANRARPGGLAQRAGAKVSGMIGSQGKAASALGERLEEDAAGGFTPAPRVTGAGAPSPMNIDDVGPSARALAENAAKRRGPARATYETALGNRQEQMRPGVSDALEAATMRKRGTGMQAFEAQNDRIGAVGDDMFGRARSATAGMEMDSPALREFVDTPLGQRALDYAKTQKLNRLQKLKASTKPGVPDGYDEAQWAGVTRDMESRGMTVPKIEGEEIDVLDPEVVHFMKQYASQVARLGVNDGAAGKLASEANAATGLWARVRNELPPEWRAADDAVSAEFRNLGQLDAGRKIFQTTNNPAGRPRAAIRKSLDAVERSAEKGSGPERAAFQTGAAHAADELWEGASRSKKSPSQIFTGSDRRERQLSSATRSPAHLDQFKNVLGAWDRTQALKDKMLGGPQTAERLIEESSRAPGASILKQVGKGNIGGSIGALYDALTKEARGAGRQRMDSEIARVLTSADPKALAEVAKLFGANRSRGNLTAGALARYGGIFSQR